MKDLTKKELAEGWIDGCWRLDIRHKCECGPNPYTEKLKNMTTKHQESSWEERFEDFWTDMYFRLETYEPNLPMLPPGESADEVRAFIKETLEAEREKWEDEISELRETIAELQDQLSSPSLTP